MKLKFVKTTPFGMRGVYFSGQTYEVENQAAAETYIAHGYAVVADGHQAEDQQSTASPGAAETNK
jgi:hypothetical protein